MTAETEQSLSRIESLGESLASVKDMVGRRIIGQDRVVELALVSMLSGGHAMLVGVPGLGKTKLVETLSKVMGLSTSRIQFTPDLMPADILGSEILQTRRDGTRHFEFLEGPVFCQLLMADEINRASPRTQSALLQAMQENAVSIAGEERKLPTPFHVLATQNPIELEGTYPLPEAQLDRFLMSIEIDYPDREAEREIVLTTTGFDEPDVQPVFGPAELIEAQAIVRGLPVGETFVELVLDLVRSCRPREASSDGANASVEWGPGPRATQSLFLASKARAILRGRLSPSVEDLAALAKPVMAHRMKLGFAFRSLGSSADDVIDEAVGAVLGAEAAV